MMATKGATAPDGCLWARDGSGWWHVLRQADLTDANGDYRRLVRSACGEWASVTPWTPGRWAEITRWLPVSCSHLCDACLATVPDADAVSDEALFGPLPEQGRLF